jgi:hypothetical protein
MKPDYIARGGDLVMAPPLELSNATMYSFLVGADLAALTAICDQQLNAVTGPGIIYKPLLPMAAIVCADIPKSYSTVPPDSLKGWMSERDFGVWIPVVAGTMEGGTWKAGKIGWYLPYVFVDNVAAMVTGREVFGFFKQTATLAMPASPTTSGAFSVDALVIQKFSPESEARVLRLMTLMSTEDAVAPAGAWGDVRAALEGLWGDLKRLFFDDVRGLPVPGWDLLKNALEDLVTGDVPMVFLKQFRDGTDPTKACYQAVLEAPAHLEKWLGGWFTHPHDISITPCDSHPIAKECGFASGPLRAELGFWCQMDFVMKPAKVIAERFVG